MESGMKMIDPTVNVAIIERYKLAYMMQFFVQHKRRFRFSKIRLQDLYHRIIRDPDTTPLCDIVARIIRYLKHNDTQISMVNVDSALDAFVLEKRTNYRVHIQRIRNARPLHDLTPESRAKLLENLIECIYDDVPDFNFATDFNKKSTDGMDDTDGMMIKAGQDSKGCSYYYMDDLRLYRERPQSSIISEWDVVVGPSREQWTNFINSLSQTEEEGDLRAFLSESLLEVVETSLQTNMLESANPELESNYLRGKEAAELKELQARKRGTGKHGVNNGELSSSSGNNCLTIKEEQGPTSVPSQSEPDNWKHITPSSAGPAISGDPSKPPTPATPAPPLSASAAVSLTSPKMEAIASPAQQPQQQSTQQIQPQVVVSQQHQHLQQQQHQQQMMMQQQQQQQGPPQQPIQQQQPVGGGYMPQQQPQSMHDPHQQQQYHMPQQQQQIGIPPAGYSPYPQQQGPPYQPPMGMPPHMAQQRCYPNQPPQQQVLVFNTAMANEAAVQSVSLPQYHQHHPLVRKFISDQKMMMDGGGQQQHWPGHHPHNMLHKPNETLTQEQLENRKMKMAELERIQSSFSKRSQQQPSIGGIPNQPPHGMDQGQPPDCQPYSQQQFNDAKREWHRLRIEFLKEKDQKAVDDIYRQRPAGPPMEMYPQGGGYPPPRPVQPYYPHGHPAAAVHRRMAPQHPGMMPPGQMMDPHGQKRPYPGYPPQMMPRPPYEQQPGLPQQPPIPPPIPQQQQPPQMPPVSVPPAAPPPVPVSSATAPTTAKTTNSKRRKTSKAAQQAAAQAAAAAAAASQQQEEVKSETLMDPLSMVRSNSDSVLAPPYMPAIDGQELTITRQYNAAFQESVEINKQHGGYCPQNGSRGPPLQQQQGCAPPPHYPQQPPAYSMAGAYPQHHPQHQPSGPCSSVSSVNAPSASTPLTSIASSSASTVQHSQQSKVPQNLTSASLASLARLSSQMPGPVGPFTSIQDQHHDLPAHSQPPSQQPQQQPSIQVNNTFVNAQLNVQQMNYQNVNGPGVSSQMQIQQHIQQHQQSGPPQSQPQQQPQQQQQTSSAQQQQGNPSGHYGNTSVQIQTKTPHTIQYLPAEPSGPPQQQPGQPQPGQQQQGQHAPVVSSHMVPGGQPPGSAAGQQPPRGKMPPEYVGPPAPSYPGPGDLDQRKQHPPYMPPFQHGVAMHPQQRTMSMPGMEQMPGGPYAPPDQASQYQTSHQMMQQSQMMATTGNGGPGGPGGGGGMIMHQHQQHMQMQYMQQTTQQQPPPRQHPAYGGPPPPEWPPEPPTGMGGGYVPSGEPPQQHPVVYHGGYYHHPGPPHPVAMGRGPPQQLGTGPQQQAIRQAAPLTQQQMPKGI